MESAFPFQLVMSLGFVAFAVVAFFYMRRFSTSNAQKAINDGAPLMRAFFERTGYAFVDARQAGPDAQVLRWQQAYAASLGGKPYDIHLVRDFYGLEVHWEQFSGQRDGGFVMAQSWSAPLGQMPRTVFHIAEASLASSVSKLAKEVFNNVATNWKPAFQRQIQTGDRELDSRFVVYGEHEESVRALLADPQLKAMLLSCSYVDLRVVLDSVRMSDPEQKNTLDMMGGTYGAMKYAGNPGAAFEVTLPVHDRMAGLLHLAASRAR